MALIATGGTVVVADDGTVTTKDGMAGEIFDEFIDNYEVDRGIPLPKGPDGAAIQQEFAIMSTRFAGGVVKHLLANAQLQVQAADGGLQRDNTVGNPATLAPVAPVTFGNLL